MTEYSATARAYFVGLYVPGPSWLMDKAIREQPLESHFTYMEQLQRDGTLVLGGPFKDDTGALAIIKASGLPEAHAVFLRDPGVSEGIFNVTVHPWFISVAGCVELQPW